MNLTDKDIDKLFREAANSAPKVEFKDAYWDEMNAFLDQEEKSKRGIYSMLSIGILALIGVGSLLLVPNENKYDVDLLAKSVNTLTHSNSNHLAINTQQTIKSSQSQEKVKTIGNKTRQALSNQHFEGEKVLLHSEHSVQENPRLSNTLDGASLNHNLADKKSSVQNTSRVLPNTVSTSSKPTVAVKTENNETVTKTATESTTAETIQSNNSVKVNNQNLLAAIGSQIGKLPFEAANKPSLGGNAQNLDLLKIKSFVRLKDRIYLEVGAGLMDNYNDAIAGRSYTYSGAINYEFRKDWFRLRTGVGMSIATNVNLTYTTSAKIYDFGSRNSSNELIYKDLYDLYLPLEIGASFKKVSFGLGYKYNFLNHSRAEFKTFNDGALKEEGTYYGLTEGLKQNTSSAYFFIERNLFGNVDLGIKMGTYLNSRAARTDMFDMVGQDLNPKYGFVYLKYNFRK